MTDAADPVTGAPGMDAEHRLVLRGGSAELAWRGAAIVGVLNVTPDSFSDGGRHGSVASAVAAGREMVTAGALFVDVGGESTRPGALPVGVDVELARVLPVVAGLADLGVVVSIDTMHPAVAEAAFDAGASILNDVAGLREPRMVEVAAAAGAPVIVVHMQGEPASMQVAPRYDDVVREVGDYLLLKAEEALGAGVPSVVLDPGIGFGKTLQHNLTLLRATRALARHGHPVMVGASRKGFLGRLTGVEKPGDRLGASLAVHLHAAQAGAALLRVHDVEAHRQALAVATALAAETDEVST